MDFPLLTYRPRSLSRQDDLRRIARALDAASSLLRDFYSLTFKAECKPNGDSVTAPDRAADQLLREMLLEEGEGGMYEESADDLTRMNAQRLSIVDPLDGTKEFVAGIPEWCVSIGLVDADRTVAGGICNPATDEVFLGSIEDDPKNSSGCRTELGEHAPVVLASRTEFLSGCWA